jgi:O-antigen/teichoic acid export membrane protein
MRAGIRDFSVTFGSRIAVMLLSTASQSGLAWWLGLADRGSLAVCMLFATMLTLACLFGCEVAAQYFVASRRLTVSEGIMNVLIYGGLGCGLAILVGFILLQMPLSFVAKANPSAFHLALVMIPLSFFSATLTNLLTAVSEFTWMAVTNVSGYGLQLVLLLVLVWYWDLGVNGALLATLIGSAATIVWVLVLFRRSHGLRWVWPSWHSIAEMFHYGIKYYVGKISNHVNFQIGAIILAFFASKEDIALFVLATTLTAQAMMIPDTLTTVLIPRVAMDKTGRRELIAQCSRVITLLCGTALLVLAIFARPIVTLLFSPAFAPAIPLVRIVAVGILIRCASKAFVPFLLNTNHPGIASMSVAAGMATNLVLLWLLLPVMGLAGAAWAMTLGYVVSSFILLQGFIRISGMAFQDVARFRKSDWLPVAEIWQGIGRRLKTRTQGAG